MVILWILLGLLLFLFLLTLFPVSVNLYASSPTATTSVRARFLFFAFDLFPLPAPKEKKPAKKKKEAKPPAEKKKGPGVSAQDVLHLVKSSRNALRILRKHLVFSGKRVYICVGAEDAHQVAIRTTYFKTFAALFLDILDSLFVLKKHETIILPAFTTEKTAYEIALTISIRPVFVLAAGLSLLGPLMRLLPRKKQTKKRQPAAQNP